MRWQDGVGAIPNSHSKIQAEVDSTVISSGFSVFAGNCQLNTGEKGERGEDLWRVLWARLKVEQIISVALARTQLHGHM